MFYIIPIVLNGYFTKLIRVDFIYGDKINLYLLGYKNLI